MPGRRDIEAGRAFVTLSLKDAKFRAGLKSLRRGVNVLGTAAIVAGGVVSAAMTKMALDFAKAGDEIGKMAKRTGLGAVALQELSFAAEQSGSNAEALEKAMAGLSRSMFDAERGSAEAVDALDALGLTADDLKGKGIEKQFTEVADAIGKLDDESRKMAVAQKLLGRSGRNLIPLMNEQADGIAKLRQEARDAGLIMSEDMVRSAEELTDAMNVFNRQLRMVKLQLAATFVPAITKQLRQIQPILGGILESIAQDRWELVGELVGIKFTEGFHTGASRLRDFLKDTFSFKGFDPNKTFGENLRKSFVEGGGLLDTSDRANEERRTRVTKILEEMRVAREKRLAEAGAVGPAGVGGGLAAARAAGTFSAQGATEMFRSGRRGMPVAEKQLKEAQKLTAEQRRMRETLKQELAIAHVLAEQMLAAEKRQEEELRRQTRLQKIRAEFAP